MRVARRQRPLVLSVFLKVFVVLLLTSIVSILLKAHAAGDVVFGLYGVVAAGVGLVLALDLRGSAGAMKGWSKELHTGPIPIKGRSFSSRKYRVIGACFVVFGIGLAVVAWSGAITWKQ